MRVLFPHHLGHYIGLDVHDSAGYPRHVNLLAGHCVTIEPYVCSVVSIAACTDHHGRGVYVPDDDRWPEPFRGIGIRVEDSVCVGDDHPIVLSPEAVKEVCSIDRRLRRHLAN